MTSGTALCRLSKAIVLRTVSQRIGLGQCWRRPHFLSHSDRTRHFVTRPQGLHGRDCIHCHPTSTIHPDAIIHPSAVIEANTFIGAGTTISANCTIGEDVVIAEGCQIGSNVTLQNCQVGSNVTIHPGVRIGQDGFGFILAQHGGSHAKKPQQLLVIIEDDVEIGANTTIDRGSWRNTIIGKGCKLDNLIQIGHNTQLGTDCVIAAQTGIAGSVTVGNRVFIGGQVGIVQHLQIGDNVRIAAKSGVTQNLAPGQDYGGHPAVPIRDYHRQVIALRKLSKGRTTF